MCTLWYKSDKAVENDLGGLTLCEHAQPSRMQRAGPDGSAGLPTLTIWPLGGWFPQWLPLFPTNNWDLIWEEISDISPAPEQVSV